MQELIEMLTNYGVMVVIVMIFLWDYIANKKEMQNTLDTLKETNDNIANCLQEMKSSSRNIEKSLDLLQKSMENTDKKIDKLLDFNRRNINA